MSRAGVSAGELVSAPAPRKHLATGLLTVFSPRGAAAGEESKDGSKHTCQPWSPETWRGDFSWPRGPSFLCFGVGSVFSSHCERKVAQSQRHGLLLECASRGFGLACTSAPLCWEKCMQTRINTASWEGSMSGSGLLRGGVSQRIGGSSRDCRGSDPEALLRDRPPGTLDCGRPQGSPGLPREGMRVW